MFFSRRSIKTILKDELQGMLDHFSAAFEIRIGVFDPMGDELACGLGRGSCGFCRFLRSDLGLEGRCRQCDLLHFAKAARGSTMIVYRCHAGLIEAIQPVRIEGGSLAGFFMIGQVRAESETLAGSIMESAARNPVLKARALRLFNEIPTISKSRLPHVLGLFSMIVAIAAEKRMVSMKGELLIGRIEEEALSDLSRGLSLAAAARLVGRSPSTISHLFKARLGVSFKQRLLQLRLDAAERFLQNGCSVGETADKCGFSSAFHFSRLFKKHRGVSPSDLKSPL